MNILNYGKQARSDRAKVVLEACAETTPAKLTAAACIANICRYP